MSLIASSDVKSRLGPAGLGLSLTKLKLQPEL